MDPKPTIYQNPTCLRTPTTAKTIGADTAWPPVISGRGRVQFRPTSQMGELMFLAASQCFRDGGEYKQSNKQTDYAEGAAESSSYGERLNRVLWTYVVSQPVHDSMNGISVYHTETFSCFSFPPLFLIQKYA